MTYEEEIHIQECVFILHGSLKSFVHDGSKLQYLIIIIDLSSSSMCTIINCWAALTTVFVQKII